MSIINQRFATELGYTAIPYKQMGEGGGQGVPYMARLSPSMPGEFVMKVFSDELDPKVIKMRNRFLIAQQFHKLNPIFCTPFDQIVHPTLAAHIASFAPGVALNDFLANAPNLMQRLCLAIAIVKAVLIMHARNIAHGDIKPENILLSWYGNAIQVHFIDCDNFRANGAPPPTSYGDPAYVPAEIHTPMEKGLVALPDRYSDAFSLGVVLHIVFFLIHPCAGFDDNLALYKKALWEGNWLHDPYQYSLSKCKCGKPPGILNGQIAQLVRRSLSLNQKERPTPEEWLRALIKALREVCPCPDCGGLLLAEPSRRICPYKNVPFSSLNIVTPDGRRIPIDSSHVAIGRDHLISKYVSGEHAIFRKVGCETYMERRSDNDIKRFVNGEWKSLAKGLQVCICKGTRLKLADVEILIE
jgi:serine/threonine protein kinase